MSYVQLQKQEAVITSRQVTNAEDIVASAGGKAETPHKAKDVRRYFWDAAQSASLSKESDKTLWLHTTLTTKKKFAGL